MRLWLASEVRVGDKFGVNSTIFDDNDHEIGEGEFLEAKEVFEHEARFVVINNPERTVCLADAMGPHRRVNSIAALVLFERGASGEQKRLSSRLDAPRFSVRSQLPPRHDSGFAVQWNAPDGAADALAADGRYRQLSNQNP